MNPFSTADSKLEALWKDLAEVDEELSILNKQVEKLAAKRKDVQREINRRLSLINRLPFEVISRILILSIESDWSIFSNHRLSITTTDGRTYCWSPLILVGAVCREWREITLALPRLWSTVIIRPYKQHTYSDITDEWLQRSGALPLSITVTVPQHLIYTGNFVPISRVLRSHSIRWKSLTFDNVSGEVFNSLLDNLEDTHQIETIQIKCGRSLGMQKPMGKPLRPKTFHWRNMIDACARIVTIKNYFQWDNLTHFVSQDIDCGEFIAIIRQATKIEHCVVKSCIQRKEHQFVPVVNRSLIHLDIDIRHSITFLQYLTLPSLQILECHCRGSSMMEIEVDVLVDFIERSQAPLRDIIYHIHVDYLSFAAGLWRPRFPDITHLKADFKTEFEHDTASLICLLEVLAYDRDEIAHPSLQVFELTAECHMTPTAWSHFINIFPQVLAERTHHERLPTNSSDTDLTPFADSPPRRRLSKACIILDDPSKTFDEQDVMELHQYLHLLDIQKSGVELELIGNGGVDLQQFARKIYGSELEARHKHQPQMAEEGL